MTARKYYAIHCDVPNCMSVRFGIQDEVPSRLRPRLNKQAEGWTSRQVDISTDSHPVLVYQDFCLRHRQEKDT